MVRRKNHDIKFLLNVHQMRAIMFKPQNSHSLTSLGLTSLGLTSLGLTSLSLTSLGLTSLGLTSLGGVFLRFKIWQKKNSYDFTTTQR